MIWNGKAETQEGGQLKQWVVAKSAEKKAADWLSQNSLVVHDLSFLEKLRIALQADEVLNAWRRNRHNVKQWIQEGLYASRGFNLHPAKTKMLNDPRESFSDLWANRLFGRAAGDVPDKREWLLRIDHLDEDPPTNFCKQMAGEFHQLFQAKSELFQAKNEERTGQDQVAPPAAPLSAPSPPPESEEEEIVGEVTDRCKDMIEALRGTRVLGVDHFSIHFLDSDSPRDSDDWPWPGWKKASTAATAVLKNLRRARGQQERVADSQHKLDEENTRLLDEFQAALAELFMAEVQEQRTQGQAYLGHDFSWTAQMNKDLLEKVDALLGIAFRRSRQKRRMAVAKAALGLAKAALGLAKATATKAAAAKAAVAKIPGRETRFGLFPPLRSVKEVRQQNSNRILGIMGLLRAKGKMKKAHRAGEQKSCRLVPAGTAEVLVVGRLAPQSLSRRAERLVAARRADNVARHRHRKFRRSRTMPQGVQVFSSSHFLFLPPKLPAERGMGNASSQKR
eukprot:g7001.t1